MKKFYKELMRKFSRKLIRKENEKKKKNENKNLYLPVTTSGKKLIEDV